MIEKFEKLKKIYAKIADINSAAALLHWDQQTYMPPLGARCRAESLSVLESIAHEKFISEETGVLISELSDWAKDLNQDSFEASYLRVIKREYDKAAKIPTEFVKEFSLAVSKAMDAWQKAKAKSDFSLFSDHLKEMVVLNRRKAGYLGYEKYPYDALLDLYEPGISKDDINSLFTEIKEGLIPLIEKIKSNAEKVSNETVKGDFGEELQMYMLNKVLEKMGFDAQKGRQDRSVHPFTISMSPQDVRVTTRTFKDYLPAGLYATMHEGGHALYELGISPEFEKTPLGGGASLGFHESQSRFWENMIGRSLPFCKWMINVVREYFPAKFSGVSAEDFYRAVNKSEPSFIRVEADEVSYNLHIFLRFEMENLLLDSKISAEDAPSVWNEKVKDYFGLNVEKDSEGVLQDVHWSMGTFGYFPTYTIGNLISVQIFNKMRSEMPDFDRNIENGNFSGILSWLGKNIYSYGAKCEPAGLLKKSLDAELDAKPFLRHVKEKYSRIYGF